MPEIYFTAVKFRGSLFTTNYLHVYAGKQAQNLSFIQVALLALATAPSFTYLSCPASVSLHGAMVWTI